MVHQNDTLFSSPLGFAYAKIIVSENDAPIDYEIIKVNEPFEKIIGLSSTEIVGVKASTLNTNNQLLNTNWLDLIPSEEQKTSIPFPEFYSVHQKKWFQVQAWTHSQEYICLLCTDITSNKNSIKSLQSKSSQFRDVFDRVPHSVFVINVTQDQQFRIQDFNDIQLEYLSMERKDVQGRLVQNVFPAPVAKSIISNYERCLKEGKEIRYEEDVKMPGKGLRYYLTTLSPRKDLGGKIFQIIGSSIDITFLKQTEEALKKSEEKYRSFVKNSSEGIYLFEFTKPCNTSLPPLEQVQHFYDHGFVSACNDTLAKMYGYQNGEELEGKKLIDFHGSEDDPEHISFLRKIIESGYRIKNEVSKELDENGNTTYLLNNVIGIVEDDVLVRMWASQRDITRQKEAEKSLKKSEALQNKLVSNIGDVIVIIDKDGNNRYKSPNVKKHFGWDAEDLVGEDAFCLIHPDDQKEAHEFVDYLINNPNAKTSNEIRYQHKNGSYRWIKFTAVNLMHDPDVQGILGNYHDITDQKEAEQTLVQQQELLTATLRSIGDGVISCNQEGKVVSVNQVAEKLTGWKSKDAEGRDIEDVFKIINSKTREKAENPVQKALEKGIIVGLANHTILISKDGSEYQIADSCAPIKDEDNEILGCVLVFRDVSQEYEQREALRESEERFRTLAYNVPGVIYLCQNDEHYTMRFINHQVEQLTGYGSEEFLDNKISFPELYHPDDAEWIPGKVDKALEEHKSFQLTYRIRHRDGSWRWVLEHGTGIFDEEDNLQYLEGYLTDITERKEAEELAHKASQQLEFHINNSPLAVIISDKNFHAKQWSKRAEELFGWTEEEVLSFDPEEWQFTYEEDEEKTQKKMLELLDGNKSSNMSRNRNYTKDGEVLHCEWYNSAMFDQNGEIISIFSLIHDISDRKAKQQQLEESLTEKETLLSEIHHRVKNNLAVVSGMMQLQAYDTQNEELQAKLFDSVIRIKTMASVHELLYKSSSFSKLNFSDTIAKLVENISETLLTSTDISLDIHCDRIKLNIHKAIPASLIVNEVVTNIYKHAFVEKDHGKVEFVATQKDDDIHILIRDNGTGINENNLENTSSLGMHLIKELTTQIDGDYKYERANPGTEFTLVFNKNLD